MRQFLFSIYRFCSWEIFKIRVSLKKYFLQLNPDIFIAKGVSIDSTVSIELRFGGRIKLGEGVQLNDHAKLITYGGNIVIGNNSKINAFTVICGHGNVEIGDEVLIAPHCMIIPANHIFDHSDIPFRLQGESKKGIKIGNNVWIGNGCSILDGVTIGDNVVIAAGSVVNKSIPSGVLAGGVPVKIIKTLFS